MGSTDIMRLIFTILLSATVLMACNRRAMPGESDPGPVTEIKQEEQENAEDNSEEEIVPPPPWDPDAEPGSPGLPLQYLGPEMPDSEAPDGRLMYSPGVQNIQISRANRSHPPPFPDDPENQLGWTYQHHTGIGCWKGKLYAVWDMAHVDEDIPPCHLVYSTSSDGFNWSEPKLFYWDNNRNSYPTLIEKEPGVFLCVWDSSDDPVSKRTAIRFGILNLNEN